MNGKYPELNQVFTSKHEKALGKTWDDPGFSQHCPKKMTHRQAIMVSCDVIYMRKPVAISDVRTV